MSRFTKLYPATLVLALFLMPSAIFANVPTVISFQGVLADSLGSPLTNATGLSMTFTIYDEATFGNVKWTEVQAGLSTDNSGVINVLMGSVTPIDGAVFDGSDRWLGIAVDTDPEMTPRTRLASVPYTAVAGRLDGDIFTSSDSSGNELSVAGPEGNPERPEFRVKAGDSTSWMGVVTGAGDTLYSFSTITFSAGAMSARAPFASNLNLSKSNVNRVKIKSRNDGKSSLVFLGELDSDTLFSIETDSSGSKLTLAGPGDAVYATTVKSSKSNSSERIGADTVISMDADIDETKITIRHKGAIDKEKEKLELFADSSGTKLTLGGPGDALTTIKTTKSNTFRMIDSLGDTTVEITDNGAFFKSAIRSGNSLIIDGPGDRVLTTSGEMYLGRDPATGSFSDVKVGIGTEGPTTKLNVFESDPSKIAIRIQGATQDFDVPSLAFQNSFSAIPQSQGFINARIAGDMRQWGPGFSINDIRTTAKIEFHGRNASNGNTDESSIRFYTMAPATGPLDERMIINQDGNVGIGTASPTTKTEISYSDVAAGANVLRLTNKTATGTAFTETGIAFNNSLVGNPNFYTARIYSKYDGVSASDGRLSLQVNTAGGLTDVLSIKDNKCGIGTTTPSEVLHVVGNICATGTIGACSDARFKRDVGTLERPLETIAKLRGVEFEWRTDEFPENKFSDEQQIGFIAQELIDFLPSIVSKGSDGFYSVDYGRLTPLLVEAIKDQQKQIESQQGQIDELKKMVSQLVSVTQTNVTLSKK